MGKGVDEEMGEMGEVGTVEGCRIMVVSVQRQDADHGRPDYP